MTDADPGGLRRIRVPVSGFGAAPATATLQIRHLDLGTRLRRGALGPALGFGVALLALPIPIVHLMLPPLAILTGVGIGVRRLGVHEVVDSATGVCPFCGEEQPLGMNGGAYRLPHRLTCRRCHKFITVDQPDSPG